MHRKVVYQQNEGMKRSFLWIIPLAFLFLLSSCTHLETKKEPITVGLSWNIDQSAMGNVERAFQSAGASVIRLPEIKAEYLSYYPDGTLSDDHMAWLFALNEESAALLKEKGYNEEELTALLQEIDLVVFSGGSDCSPNLYETPTEDESEEQKDATRDVSDYLLMTYCLDHDIPLLGICRGMQLLGIVSGGTMIQDLSTYYKELGIPYESLHRAKEGDTYVPHDVMILPSSKLYSLVQVAELQEVPSKHHQALERINEANTRVSAYTMTQGRMLIEGIERTDKTLALGVQYHPEVLAGKRNDAADASFGDEQKAQEFFLNLIQSLQKTQR